MSEETKNIDKTKRSRGWCFTHNNYTPEHEEFWKSFPCEYLIAGKEVAPTTNTPHLQGFFLFKDAKTFSSVQKKIPTGVHIEPARSVPASIEYCKKGGDFFFLGHLQLGKVDVPNFLQLKRLFSPGLQFPNSTTPTLKLWLSILKELWNIGISLSGPVPHLLLYTGYMDQLALERLELFLIDLEYQMFTLNRLDGGLNHIINNPAAFSTTFPPINYTLEISSDC